MMDADTIRAQAMLNLLTSQRDQALNAFVECAGELAVARARIAELEAPKEEPPQPPGE